MGQIGLIIFDLDGTLINSSNNIVDAVNFALKSTGVKERTKEEIISYVGTGSRDLINKSLGNKDGVILERALSTFREYYRKHAISNSVLYPNVKEVLEYFKSKKKIILTNGSQETTSGILRSLGIDNYFEDVIGGREEIGCLKPSPCNLDKVMNRLNVNKDRTIIVGDMDVDILAGKNAGILTCGVIYGIGKSEDIIRAEPDFIISDILDLKNIIN